MSWQNLIHKLVVGTQREHFTDSTMLALRSQFGSANFYANSDDARLLEMAAFYAMTARAGHALSLADAAAIPTAAASEDFAYANTFVAQQLKTILYNGSEELILESLLLLTQAQQLVPPNLLPLLLDKAKENPNLLAVLPACIGARGRWLLQLNPSWKNLAYTEPLEGTLELLTKNEHIAFLVSLRYQSPEEVLPYFAKLFKTENSIVRVQLMDIFSIYLSSTDASFLESCLTDASKEVRRKAIAYLCRLPDSAYIQRMQARLAALVNNSDWKKITLPSLDAGLKEDLVDINYKDWEASEQEYLLTRIIAATPPQYWLDKKITAEDYIKQSEKHPYRTALWIGWLEAAQKFEHKDWLYAFYNWSLTNKSKHNLDIGENVLDKTFQSPITYQQLAMELLQSSPKQLPDGHWVVDFMMQHSLPLNDDLVRELIKRIRATVANDTHFMNWNLRGLLTRLSFFVNPYMYEWLQEGWDEKSLAWASWQTSITHFLNTVRLRLELYKTLDLSFHEMTPSLVLLYNSTINKKK